MDFIFTDPTQAAKARIAQIEKQYLDLEKLHAPSEERDARLKQLEQRHAEAVALAPPPEEQIAAEAAKRVEAEAKELEIQAKVQELKIADARFDTTELEAQLTKE